MLKTVNKEDNLIEEFLRSAQIKTIDVDGHSIQLYVPDESQMLTAYQEKQISFPYWSKLWPAALALSEFLLKNTSYITEKRVIEFGAGLGLPSIVAARYAKEVWCTDHSPEAIAFAALSAQHNQVQNVKTVVADWNDLQMQFEADVILLSDVNYDPEAFDALLQQLRRFLQHGKTILLSTPQRLMAKNFLLALLPHSKYTETISILDRGATTDISVFVLQNKE